ncbi:MAG: hypothetical protein MJZ26_04130 [Fibrobacter sp.]|nr:hypothetical protein [Fibrobacter sp.]
MNLENMNVLSQKIEGVLGTVRTLREENAKVKAQLASAQAALQDKTMLLDSANQNLAGMNAALTDAKAALDARANQAAALDESVTAKQAEINSLSEQLNAQNAAVASLQSQLQEMSEKIAALNATVNEKLVSIANLTEQLAAKEQELASKNQEIEVKDQELQAQADEIAEAQEKFQQLVSTIETELGTELPIVEADEMPADEISDEESFIDAADVPEMNQEPEVKAEDVVEEPEILSKEPAKNNASGEGSQTSFFRLNWLMDADPFGVGMK